MMSRSRIDMPGKSQLLSFFPNQQKSRGELHETQHHFRWIIWFVPAISEYLPGLPGDRGLASAPT
jgi:hypothetical protein